MEEKSELLYNLLALGFDVQSQEIKYGCQFDENVFNKPNKRAFEVVTHFLFHKLEPKRATDMFRTCFPGTGKKCTQEFRKVTFNWLKKIFEENPNFGLPKVTSTLLMSPGGKDFIHLMFNFSLFVLYKRTTALRPHGVLHPPIPTKSNRVKPQVTVHQAMTVANFKQLQAQMQVIKKADDDLQAFADQQIDAYHALQKKKRHFLQETKQLLGNAANFSELKVTEFKKQQNRILSTKMETARTMWNTVNECVDDTAPHREIIESVLSDEVSGIKLDGSKLHPSIPAKLIDECQEEIYQTVGTSLYENGNINLKSLVALDSLSLTLLADTMHEEGFPNFDKQNSWLKTRAQIHKDELSKLMFIRNNLEKEKIHKINSIRETEKRLDAVYAARPSRPDETNDVGLDVPDATFDAGRDAQFQDLPPCKEGIAVKYLLPSGDLDSFLEDVLLNSDDEKSNRSGDLGDVAMTSRQGHSPNAWVVSGSDHSSSRNHTPVSRKTAKTQKLTPSSLKSGKPLKQGKTKRVNIPINSRNPKPGDVSSYLKASLDFHSNPSSPRMPASRGRLSMSLPSSPLMTYRSDDVIVQKVTSRTPEAESKLIDQIAHCTCEDRDGSLLIVYEQNGKSQLDRTAFVSHDKIPRTPPDLPQLSSSESSHSGTTSSNPSFNEVASSDDDLPILYPPCGSFSPKKQKQEKDAGGIHPYTVSPLSALSGLPGDDSSNLLLGEQSSLFSALHTNSSTMSAIDNALESMIEENPSGILDVSTPLFTEIAEFDETLKTFHLPATDTLISLEPTDQANYSRSSPDLHGQSGSRAVELLMSTPPPPADTSATKENNSPFLIPTASKESLPGTPERPLLHQFQLNLLPVPDFHTPELQHFKSVLKRK